MTDPVFQFAQTGVETVLIEDRPAQVFAAAVERAGKVVGTTFLTLSERHGPDGAVGFAVSLDVVYWDEDYRERGVGFSPFSVWKGPQG